MSTQTRFTLDEFDRMIDAAVFNPDRRIELLFGELLEMSPIGERHRRVIVLLTEWAGDATAQLRDRLGVQVQNPLRLPAEQSEITMPFTTDGEQRIITIAVPQPTSPQEIGPSSDTRKLGIALSRMTNVYENTAPTGK